MRSPELVNIAFLLLSIGTLGLVYELASPGIGVGGALGTTFIVLALFGLAVLPVNMVGIIVLVLAAVLFIADRKISRCWLGWCGCLFFVIPIIDRMVKVNLQTVTADIPPRTSSPRTT